MQMRESRNIEKWPAQEELQPESWEKHLIVRKSRLVWNWLAEKVLRKWLSRKKVNWNGSQGRRFIWIWPGLPFFFIIFLLWFFLLLLASYLDFRFRTVASNVSTSTSWGGASTYSFVEALVSSGCCNPGETKWSELANSSFGRRGQIWKSHFLICFCYFLRATPNWSQIKWGSRPLSGLRPLMSRSYLVPKTKSEWRYICWEYLCAREDSNLGQASCHWAKGPIDNCFCQVGNPNRVQ